jgi:hypothetical protein
MCDTWGLDVATDAPFVSSFTLQHATDGGCERGRKREGEREGKKREGGREGARGSERERERDIYREKFILRVHLHAPARLGRCSSLGVFFLISNISISVASTIVIPEMVSLQK